jgi:large subunit ribosomal protein L24
VSSQRIRKNDQVIATAGAHAGRSGKVLEVRGGRVLVEGVNLRKKTLRRTQDNPQGGITEKECPVAVSNVMPFCSQCKKGVRVSHAKDGTRIIRKCRSCGHSLDG